MSRRTEKAEALFIKGYNCCQAVVGAYCDLFGIDEETGLRLSAGMGGGMGRLREVCGTCSGMFLVAGMARGDAADTSPEARGRCYALVQAMAKEFREKNGSIVCKELLGIDGDGNPVPSVRDSGFYQKRPCRQYVRDAAEILEKTLGIEGD